MKQIESQHKYHQGSVGHKHFHHYDINTICDYTTGARNPESSTSLKVTHENLVPDRVKVNNIRNIWWLVSSFHYFAAK